jgi:membrane protease YdiL (CAAX protease family)
MRNPFRHHKAVYSKQVCQSCGRQYDPALRKCPECGAPYHDERVIGAFAESTVVSPGKETALFLVGWVGLIVIELIVEFIVIGIATQQYAGAGMTGDELGSAISGYISSGEGLAAIFIPTYIILCIVMMLILWKDLPRVFSRFAKWKTYLGIVMGIVLLFASALYSLAISAATDITSNQNQSNVDSMLLASPGFAVVVLGLIGPFCEECAYRLGLYDLLKRRDTTLALIVSSLVFAFIHFDWSNAGSANEWLNMPSYLISGAILALTYEYFGFGGSYLAHATNNIVALILTLSEASSA